MSIAQRYAGFLQREAANAATPVKSEAIRQAANKLLEIDQENHRLRAELAEARGLRDAHYLACGLLWMAARRSDKVTYAYNALRDAIGGPASEGLRRAIKMAIDAGHEADHPADADWWAGKKDDAALRGEGESQTPGAKP